MRASEAVEDFWNCSWRDGKVVDSGDSRDVASILAFEETLNQGLVDVTEEVLDWFIFDDGPFDSHGTL